jgi:hypothetical protein
MIVVSAAAGSLSERGAAQTMITEHVGTLSR